MVWPIALFVLSLYTTNVTAQGASNDMHAFFESDTVSVEMGSTFTNILMLENTGSENISFQGMEPKEKYPGLIFYPRTEIILSPGEKRRLPVKFIANLDFLRMVSDSIQFTVFWNTSKVTTNQNISFIVSCADDKHVVISPLSRENFLQPGVPESIIPILVENRSYTPRNIRLEFQSIPDGLEISPKQQTIILGGLERQMIEIKVSIRRYQTQFPEYQIEVAALDLEDDEKVGNTKIYVTELSHNRQVSRYPNFGRTGNFLEMNYSQHSTGLNYLQFRGNTEFAIVENLITRFNLQADTYLQEGLYNLYDTWLELEHETTNLRLGNIYGSDYDYSISGRGGKLSTKFNSNQELEMLALENNYNLYGTYFPQNKGAKMVGAKYKFEKPNSFKGKVSYIFDHDPRLSINSHVANFLSSISIRQQHNFGIEAGISHEKGLIDNGQNLGATIGMNYEMNRGAWNFQSLNSYATRSYAGLSRGSFDISQRINRELRGHKRVFLQYQNSQIQPEYLNFQSQPEYVRPNYFYSTQALKSGFQFSAQDWNFVFSPQVLNQKSTFNDNSHELLAYRLHAHTGTSFGNHGFTLATEYSYARKDNERDWFHGGRVNMSYRLGRLTVNGSAQWNPNNVIDLNSYYLDDQNFVNYHLYTGYDFQLWNKAISGAASVGITYSELYQSINNNGMVNLEYKISPFWSATGYFNISEYRAIVSEGFRGSNYQVRFGVKKYFAVGTSPGNYRVSFVVFADANFNTRLDKDEEVLGNEVVKLNEHVAITDENGKVTFQNVPKGSYTVTIQERTGSHKTMEPLLVNQNIKMELGISENVRVSGKLSEVRQPYDDLDTDVRGVVVYARTDDGEVLKTMVNRDYEFEFYLQYGTYEIYIENDQFSFINPVQTIILDEDVDPEFLVFEYKKKNTTIKVKTF